MKKQVLLIGMGVCYFTTVLSAAIAYVGNVSPNPANWSSDTDVYVGKTAWGRLSIYNGEVANCRVNCIGYHPGVPGTLRIDGAGSELNTQNNNIGLNGIGTLDVTNGGKITGSQGVLGFYTGSSGRVTVDGIGSRWESGNIIVGLHGSSSLNITNGGVVTGTGSIINLREDSSGKVTVDGHGSKWMLSEELQVGWEKNGSLEISNGGLVSVGDYMSIGKMVYDLKSYVKISNGGMLALKGKADDPSWLFMNLIRGNEDNLLILGASDSWVSIRHATYGRDYTLKYITEGELSGYTVLRAVPEPCSLILLGLGGLALRRRRR